MTHLRKMMPEELDRRNYAQTTIDCSPEHIREYQAYLFRERKLPASTVTQRLAALRFFYTQTIKKTWSVADTPYPKKTRHLPSILSPEEVAHLINSSQTRVWVRKAEQSCGPKRRCRQSTLTHDCPAEYVE